VPVDWSAKTPQKNQQNHPKKKPTTTGRLLRLEAQIDPPWRPPRIPAGELPAQWAGDYFARVKGCRVPMVATCSALERVRVLFRDTLAVVRHLVELKSHPVVVLAAARALKRTSRCALELRPKRGPAPRRRAHQTTVGQTAAAGGGESPAAPCQPAAGLQEEHRPGWRHSKLACTACSSPRPVTPDRQIGLTLSDPRGRRATTRRHCGAGVPSASNPSRRPARHDPVPRPAPAGGPARTRLGRRARRAAMSRS